MDIIDNFIWDEDEDDCKQYWWECNDCGARWLLGTYDDEECPECDSFNTEPAKIEPDYS